MPLITNCDTWHIVFNDKIINLNNLCRGKGCQNYEKCVQTAVS